MSGGPGYLLLQPATRLDVEENWLDDVRFVVMGVRVRGRNQLAVKNMRVDHELERVRKHGSGAVQAPALRYGAGETNYPGGIPAVFTLLVSGLVRDHFPPSTPTRPLSHVM